MGVSEVIFVLVIVAALFFAWVGIVQLGREKRWVLLALLGALCFFAGVGITAFAVAGVVKFGAWRQVQVEQRAGRMTER